MLPCGHIGRFDDLLLRRHTWPFPVHPRVVTLQDNAGTQTDPDARMRYVTLSDLIIIAARKKAHSIEDRATTAHPHLDTRQFFECPLPRVVNLVGWASSVIILP